MIILNESLVNYIFLSRVVPLPLSALKIIKKRISFDRIMNYSEKEFKTLLYSIKTNDGIKLREIDKKVSNFINLRNEKPFNRIKRDLEICKENQIKCFGYFNEKYPKILKNIGDPPKLIFIKGEIKPEDEKAVAIIGTRKPTAYGEKMAKEIARRLSEAGFTIVSGLARGIDTIAIKSALESGGRAIGVIASGILNLYPRENEYIIDSLVRNGALISERFPEKSVHKKALQIRNRITSGLGLGNIFVEGTFTSGTKHQLKFGNAQKRLSIAVEPIDYECDQAYVPLKVINEGGVRISNIDDVDFVIELLLEELNGRKKQKKCESIQTGQTGIFDFLSSGS